MAYTTVNKSTDYFNTKLYTGNGSTQSITGVGFAPDMVWTKKRSATDFHAINDKVRGALKIIFPNTTDAEDTSSGCLTSFDSDGFSLGSNSGFNANTATFASWNWLANGAGSSNTDGSITSTVSANTTSGFSISTYTGTGANATVGHGLGVAPSIVLCKNTSTTSNWEMYHSSIGAGGQITLNNTNAAGNDGNILWNSTAPTSSLFSVGTNVATNNSGSTMIAYCFAEKTGFSKFGEYTGNENANGTFVYTGFKPAFVMIKNRGASSTDWFIHDNKRLGYNEKNYGLFPNLTNAEATDINLDLLSNGFKLRRSTNQLNHAGNYYIYMAFAEAPLVGSNNVPANAR